ncbi:MAG: hypothetical protein RLZZ628_3146 [Bacteroidota bacterium]|jgi:hypothetical protein
MENRKLFVLSSECNIIGIFSNMTLVANGCPVDEDKRSALYHKIYRHFKAHEQSGKPLGDFYFEYTHEEKVYELKVYWLNGTA